MKLEYDTLSALLYKPEEINKIELNEQWFFDRRYREIARAILATDSKLIETNTLYETIRNNNPNTLVDARMLEDMRIDGFGSECENNAKTLKHRFYKERFDEKSRIYAQTPDNHNFDLMKDALRELEALEKSEDDGKIDGTVEEIFLEIETEAEKGIKSFNRFDKIMGGGMFGGQLIVIAARPAVGKTAFSLNLGHNAMMQHPDLQEDFFTLEMNKKQMVQRFMSKMSHVNSMKFRNPKLNMNDAEKAKVTASGIQLINSNLRVHDSMFHIKEIERQIRRRHFESKGKPYLAIIDYLGLIESSDSRQPRHVQVGEITRTLKILTNELNIPIILLSQLNRGIENRQDKRPNLADIRESGSVEQDANVVCFLHEADDMTILSVAKNREGFTGDIEYNFLKSKMTFEEIPS